MSRIKFRDSDTGESTLYVVEVPEGYSIQIDQDFGDYLSCIISPEQARQLRDFLGGNDA